jgi:hypothetical protein
MTRHHFPEKGKKEVVNTTTWNISSLNWRLSIQ